MWTTAPLRRAWLTPAGHTLLLFAIAIALGTVLLAMPTASAHGRLATLDALFTSTSATCVTGLVVVDTGEDLSLFGQLVVLLLIQTGGLGIMTVSTAFLMAAGRRPSISERLILQDTFTAGKALSLREILANAMRFTFLMEGLGTAVLFLRFLPNHTLFRAFYLALFHSISAFCNAGFSPFSDSLIAYSRDVVVNVVFCILIISGGLGFLVVSELRRKIPTRGSGHSNLSLHTKLVLTTTAVLLVVGTLLILTMERVNTLQDRPFPDQVLAAFFQSVTARTAGFNTVPIASMANQTLFVLILLMFIGASPGSCGGGIKTGTFATLVVWGFSRLRGQLRPQAFQRSISEASMARAISVTIIGSLVVIIATFLLLMTEIGGVSHAESRGQFLELLFESMSAFGTVGLSMGMTPELSPAGKIIITLVMYIGRTGPLVIALAITRRKAVHYSYAEEHVMIG